ncbi:MAG: group 1 glycosyl transferase [uncultured bacterium]|nr:MAG: group 1 glycosyl transferase [uncultured bacterium]
MKIAIHAADLDHDRIDGTRVYILNMLKKFGELNKEISFTIYHRSNFNSRLTPPQLSNYSIKKLAFPSLWTQLRFALEIYKDNPDVLWMPMHNLPLLRRKKLKTVITIHDLAFKIFPEYFPRKDLLKLNNLTDYGIINSDRIIAVSHSTKKDILKFYPKIKEEKIHVVHHGFDKELFEKCIPEEVESDVLSEFKIKNSKFILYVGALQPRKDLITLVKAFEKIKEKHPQMKLVLAGAPAWHAEGVLKKISDSMYRDDIIITGTVGFDKIPVFYKNAAAFIFPSLYEGFGIPVLEAFASGVPTILADNSSLVEVGGDAACYFKTSNEKDLEDKIEKVLSDETFRNGIIEKGKIRAGEFSWDKCSEKTLDILSNW